MKKVVILTLALAAVGMTQIEANVSREELVTMINLNRAEKGQNALPQRIAHKLREHVSMKNAGAGLTVSKVVRPGATLTPAEQAELSESLQGLDLE